MLLLAQGLTAAATAEALERDPHTIGPLRQAQEGRRLRRGRSRSFDFSSKTGGSPPPLTKRSRRS